MPLRGLVEKATGLDRISQQEGTEMGKPEHDADWPSQCTACIANQQAILAGDDEED